MVHRILGPGRAAGLVLLTLAATPSRASAYCQTTTCAVTNPPPECQRDADGCYTAGIPLYWEQQCISYAVSQTGSPALGIDYDAANMAAAVAFGLWLTTSCGDGPPSIAVMNRGPLLCDRHEYNPTGPNANAILFRDEGWTHDVSAIALTTVSFSSRTGKILDADMEINSGSFELTTLSLEYVMAHEAGHFFGLDHSSVEDALMNARYTINGAIEPELKPDDQAAICAAYPLTRDTPPTCTFEPAKGYAADCGGNVTASCAVAPARSQPTRGRAAGALGALLVLAALASRARTRRRRPPNT